MPVFPLDPQSYLDAISSHSAGMAAAARGRTDAPVPTCPGWDLSKLLLHQGLVHRWVTGLVGGPEAGDARAPDGDARAEWLLEGADRLVGALGEAGTERPSETWVPDNQRSGFWFRRMAHETAVHRTDAEAASGAARPLDPLLAADGVDEVFAAALTARSLQQQPVADLAGTMRLEATDVGAAWNLLLSPQAVTVTDDADGPDATVSGPAAAVLMYLWNRPLPANLEISGDVATAERWSQVRI